MAELEREIVIDASPETVFKLLTVPEHHLRWEGTEVELDPRPGGVYRVLIAGSHQASGEFVEVVPNERIVHTFGWEHEGNPVPPGSSRVEYTLTAEGDKTRLRLVHSGLPDAQAVEMHIHGWDHYLARLGVAAAGGEAGPDLGPGS
jgi:uncharacterized protein YndB with AHSA1/START domain